MPESQNVQRQIGNWLIASVVVAVPLLAQQPAQPQPLSVKQIKPDIYYVTGGGGNSGVIIGTTGVVVVDAKTTLESGKDLLAEITKLTPKKITHVVLTHSDGDHVNGLAAFPGGLTIIAHEGNKKEQEAALAAGGRGALPPDKLPTQVVSTIRETMTIDGVKFEFLHWSPAHTNGDLVVFLPDQKVVFTGDIIATNRPDPLIHLEKNGSSEGWITTTKGIVGLDADQFVPGHGDVVTKADVQARLTAAQDKRDKIAAMVKDGKSLDDIKTALGDTPAPAPPAGPPTNAAGRGQAAGPPAGRGGGGFASFTEVVYQELTRKTQ